MSDSGWLYLVVALNYGTSLLGLSMDYYPVWWGFADAFLAILVAHNFWADRKART